MEAHQVLAKFCWTTPTTTVSSEHQFSSLADARNALASTLADARDALLSFSHLECNSLLPHDFIFPNSGLQALLRGQDLVETLALRMAPLRTSDRVHALDITHWQMHSLRSLHIYGFFPRDLGNFPNGMGNEFSNLTSLTLGRVDGLHRQITVPFFFAMVATWRVLQHLEIEGYSHLMLDATERPNHLSYLPELKKLSLTDDEPAWISKVLTYTNAPNLTELRLRTVININIPGATAAMLTSWLPVVEDPEDTDVYRLLRRVSKVVVHMPEDEHQPTQIVGLTDGGSPALTLEMAAIWPLGMDNVARRAQHANWSRSPRALGQIINGLPGLFLVNVSALEARDDFDSVLASHWTSFLHHFSGLLELRVDAHGGHGVGELFAALASLDKDDQDVVCPNLGVLSVERARYSRLLVLRIANMLGIRREAPLAHVRLNLLGSFEEYEADFAERNPMDGTSLGDAARNGVGSFNLRIADWQDIGIYTYGG